jgi:hypothetical protein
MLEFLEDDASNASYIIEQLLESNNKKLAHELEKDIVIFDLEVNVRSFLNDLEIANGKIPAMRMDGYEEYVPISFQSIFNDFQKQQFGRFWMHRHPYDYYMYDIIRMLENKKIEGIFMIDSEQAQIDFKKLANKFLATRIAAIRKFREREWDNQVTLNLFQTVGGAQVNVPGCNFSVSTNASGLRVFWSGAYYRSPNYFSHPTTPATSVLQAGIYIFGVDGGAYSTIHWDADAVVSLPGKPSVHLNY